ncbi:hypothetical protein N657DRAFT_361577 [Parathielavia appendiculata]|uniref:RRM domain-containing protein n=1 Tax=Parathielavia appendiculata TaxID=2587402 RepID=A0AAN6Z5T6_9PEZI|nr:hypothetical protein N657DRAFT_361577 [Parathielavia appendiculata]
MRNPASPVPLQLLAESNPNVTALCTHCTKLPFPPNPHQIFLQPPTFPSKSSFSLRRGNLYLHPRSSTHLSYCARASAVVILFYLFHQLGVGSAVASQVIDFNKPQQRSLRCGRVPGSSLHQLPLPRTLRVSTRSHHSIIAIAATTPTYPKRLLLSATLHASRGMNGDHNPPSAIPGAPVNGSFAALSSNRATLFPATAPATKNTMAVPAFLPPAQAYRPPAASQSGYKPSLPTASSFDRDTKKPMGTPLSVTPPTLSSALIRNLPLNTSEESLRLMMVFSKDLVDVEVLPAEQSPDSGFRSAILKFKSPAGAQEAKNMLDGKSNISNDAEMIVEILGSSSPTALGNPFPSSTTMSTSVSNATVSTTPSAPSSRQTSRFNGTFQSLEKASPPMNTIYGDMAGHEPGASYQNLFGPQSPIGNHLANGTRITSKSLIDSADDDETKELLKDPVGFAENGLHRRQTAPQLPISRLAGLSLNTTPSPAAVHPQMPYYGHAGMGSLSGLSNTMSPTAMASPGPGYNPPIPHRMNNFPPANPADQNPPCNTLYVGNLPIDTSEEELKAMFSRQRGYKRLCFRTKQNGPMCFVEFEDVTFATKALHELYGQPLHNSVKGGIRLSFSKNPLGVRSGQNQGQNGAGAISGMNGMHSGAAGGFTTANGPPPGLTAPPGLSVNRGGYTASPSLATGTTGSYTYPTVSNGSSNPWGGMYGGNGPMMAGTASAFPPYMMGR